MNVYSCCSRKAGLWQHILCSKDDANHTKYHMKCQIKNRLNLVNTGKIKTLDKMLSKPTDNYLQSTEWKFVLLIHRAYQ